MSAPTRWAATRAGACRARARHDVSPYEPVFAGARQGELDELLTRYPTKMAALLPALWMVQHERGWVSDEGMAEVAEVLELTPAYVKGVVTFYTMYHQHPVGKHFIQVCTTSPCNVCGAEEVVDAFLKHTGCQELGADLAGRQVHRDRSRMPRRVRLRDADHDQRGLHRVGDAGDGARDSSRARTEHGISAHSRTSARRSSSPSTSESRRRSTLDGWKKRGGYAALEKALGMAPGRHRRTS